MELRTKKLASILVFGAIGLGGFGAALCLNGCASNEPVGSSKTTTKTVNDTPTEKTTVTETREKSTTITPR